MALLYNEEEYTWKVKDLFLDHISGFGFFSHRFRHLWEVGMYLYWQIKDCPDLSGCCGGTHHTRKQVHGCRRGTVLFLLKRNRSCHAGESFTIPDPKRSDPWDSLWATRQYPIWTGKVDWQGFDCPVLSGITLWTSIPENLLFNKGWINMSVELKLPPIYSQKWKRLLSGSDQAEVNRISRRRRPSGKKVISLSDRYPEGAFRYDRCRTTPLPIMDWTQRNVPIL